jgi:hypothetical protein
MGFRFRKSIKAGPLKINMSKSGIGYSVGTKGARITKTAKGKTRVSANIPGTGVSYSTSVGKKRRSGSAQKGGGGILIKGFLLVVAAMFLIAIVDKFKGFFIAAVVIGAIVFCVVTYRKRKNIVNAEDLPAANDVPGEEALEEVHPQVSNINFNS